jgi:ferric-dicitrate binding protein FerR (iron transport regulator)
LNPSSEIAFQQAFEDTVRQVRLKGEAWFNVTHHADKPFIVNTQNLTTRVLGTRFCVDDYPKNGQVAVYLQTGSVEINSADSSHSHVLHPGEYLVYDKSTHQIHISARKPPYLYFRNASLEEIRYSLERKFNIPIKLEGISEEKYTLEFDSTATVREVLETLCVLDEHLTWRIGHNHTIILSIKHE